MSDQNFSQLIRSSIVPISAVKQKPAQYKTSWASTLTFQQIYDDLAHYVSNVMKGYGLRPHEIPDCLQIGFMVLWQTLTEQPDFLTQKTRRQAVFFVLARCKISSMRYGEGRYDSYEALTTDDWHSTGDEHAITGLEADRDEWWAAWATDIDIRTDVEQIMRKLAEKYADSFRHLIALYAMTTQVTRKDAAALAGVTSWNWHKTYEVPMLQEIRYEFAQVFLEDHSYTMPQRKENAHGGQYKSPYPKWREQYRQGHTEPAEALLQQYNHTVCVAGAIRAQIDGKTYQQAAIDLGKNPKTFPKYMKRAARMLSAAYA